MTIWELFFTSKPTVPPHLGPWYFLLPTSLVVVTYLSIRYASSKRYRDFWYWGQLIQLLIINAWYISAHLPLSEALPFYHSRMAMWIILFAPNKTFFKQLLCISRNLWFHNGLGLSSLLSFSFPSCFVCEQCFRTLGPLG